MMEAKKQCLGEGKGRRGLEDKRKVWHMGKPPVLDERKASWRLWKKPGQCGSSSQESKDFSHFQHLNEMFRNI